MPFRERVKVCFAPLHTPYGIFHSRKLFRDHFSLQLEKLIARQQNFTELRQGQERCTRTIHFRQLSLLHFQKLFTLGNSEAVGCSRKCDFECVRNSLLRSVSGLSNDSFGKLSSRANRKWTVQQHERLSDDRRTSACQTIWIR